MRPVVFGVGAADGLVESLSRALGAEVGVLTMREFPDAETYVRIDTDCAEREILLAANLHEPNRKTLSLLLVADTAKDLGARRVGLVVPYLPYMRQDTRFNPGEGITARYFARILSMHVDWLITCDPHLHRIHELAEIYPIPAAVVPAAPAIASWIAKEVHTPVLIGPDQESEQWVADVAGRVGAPYLTLTKTRHGDRSVSMSLPDLDRYLDRTPVLVDDIVSTGHTFKAALESLGTVLASRAVCIAVHAIFAAGAVEALRGAGAARVVSCNTVAHVTNVIDMHDALAERAGQLLAGSAAVGAALEQAVRAPHDRQ